MPETRPLIKGMFVNSHVRALEKKRGAEALQELERRFGANPLFGNLEDVPVATEVTILKLVYELEHGATDPDVIDYESGRLHFENFSRTPFARLLMSPIPRTGAGFQMMLKSSGYISSHVFKNIRFSGGPLSDTSMESIMENSGYPLHHFRGLYFAWLEYWGLPDPHVEASAPSVGTHRYFLHWN